ncbi:lycopene beta-cyclase CrtY [Novosphingobium mangrovi (ex Huang et al. 2023)]|uniref:Lycopene beta-cyclase CrtY n=1 Tax=Novosphingobium mangrovi (ex Huang et al. 2023) TaxID=2976432 RepID=A0ABT2HZS2_9SPHN|nr:lycopene beta-cyclase CrtY [Novosphingobium mangrovi (ex Huang et al. 2023)]MCT2398048.1 lycopene beta-cyclase CrtY [Novosphingobium mangrovi (ex Huang et al. 2023)]
MQSERCDLAVLGGGLSGGLVALAMARHRPDLRVILIERGEKLGGDHVWSFFASDLPPGGEELVEPLIAARWPGYDVHFPGRSRRLSTPYRSATSMKLDAAVRAALPGECIVTGAEVCAATPTSVVLAGGRTIAAGAVIDARGTHGMAHMTGGWQKFMGQTLRLSAPHGLSLPVVMDARVEQVDGYRFVYCLPFSPTEVFVEDTYYADTPALDLPVLRRRLADYAAQHGWRVEAVAYEEAGVLPVIAAGDFDAFWQAGDSGAARAGTAAALIHPLTSYSFPDAVKFALYLSALDNLSGASLERASHAWAADHWRRGRFYRMLSRMLFGAARPEARWRVLKRFYGLPRPLIERFYAGRSGLADKARILAGKPPVPISAALASLAGRGRPLADLATDGRDPA